MSLESDFELAVERSKRLSAKPSNENLLKLYSLYKQATVGDVTGTRPGGFDFKSIAKYDAWATVKGTSKESAMKSYIELVNTLE